MMSSNNENSNSEGRPTKYKDEFVGKVYKLALLGATDKDVADFFDVCEATINNWKIEYPEFLESIKKGKTEADSDVAERLYKRAVGYQYKEVSKQFEGEKLIKKTETTKTLAPDPTAQIFWLKNRQKDQWRDSKNIDHTTGGEKVNGRTAEDIKKELKEILSGNDSS